MWFRFRLSTLLVAVPLLGLVSFGGLKWYEKLSEVEFVYPCAPFTSTMAPVTWVEDDDLSLAYPESDFGPLPVERPIRLW
jgi:hypothetical protein